MGVKTSLFIKAANYFTDTLSLSLETAALANYQGCYVTEIQKFCTFVADTPTSESDNSPIQMATAILELKVVVKTFDATILTALRMHIRRNEKRKRMINETGLKP